MKKVINGIPFYTETAKEVANWGNGLTYYDLFYEAETLYVTKKRFLHENCRFQ